MPAFVPRLIPGINIDKGRVHNRTEQAANCGLVGFAQRDGRHAKAKSRVTMKAFHHETKPGNERAVETKTLLRLMGN